MSKAERHKKRRDRKKHRSYIMKQKMLGVLLLVFTVLISAWMEDDASFAIITMPIACMFIFSKEKLFMNDYYFKAGEEANVDDGL